MHAPMQACTHADMHTLFVYVHTGMHQVKACVCTARSCHIMHARDATERSLRKRSTRPHSRRGKGPTCSSLGPSREGMPRSRTRARRFTRLSSKACIGLGWPLRLSSTCATLRRVATLRSRTRRTRRSGSRTTCRSSRTSHGTPWPSCPVGPTARRVGRCAATTCMRGARNRRPSSSSLGMGGRLPCRASLRICWQRR